MARWDFAPAPRSALTHLGQADLDLLLSVAEEVAFEADATIWELGEPFDAANVILSGGVRTVDEAGAVSEVGAGQSLGMSHLLIGGRHESTAVTIEPARMLRLPLDAVHELATRHDGFLHAVSSAINQQLRTDALEAALENLFGSLERASLDDLADSAEWVELAPGDVLFSQDDPGDALYILLDGILGAWAASDGEEVFLNEIAPSETIGEMALISRAGRSATIRAVKPALLIRLARDDFEATAQRHPIVYKALAGVLADYLVRSRTADGRVGGGREIALLSHGPDRELLGTVAQLLGEALAAIGPTLHLNVARLEAMDDLFPFDIADAVNLPLHDPSNTRFDMWLTQQRRRHAFILYETDDRHDMWRRLCVDRADELVIVARAVSEPTIGALERSLPDQSLVPQRLVLIHDGAATPSGTSRWLAGRRFARHHHVRLDSRSDFARLARHLGGRAIGLVLGGGGARGFAHIGVIQAFHDAGVPIDIVGGTSSGGMSALMYALDIDPVRLAERNQHEWVEQRPWSRYAPPVLSILNHSTWDRIFASGFRGKDIEDLWIPAFCVSSNIDAGRMVIHETGAAWKAVRATCSIPGLLAPVLYDGEAHVDGGIMNNLPTDVMRARTKGPVFAVSLGRRTPQRMPFETYPSPWRLTRDVLNPLKRTPPMHTLPKVMLLIASLSDMADTEERVEAGDVLFEPPVESCSLTDFSDPDGIIRIGYEHAIDRLEALAADEGFAARMRAAGVAMTGQGST